MKSEQSDLIEEDDVFSEEFRKTLFKDNKAKAEEDDIYSEEIRKDLLEDDEITAIEEAFMEGYDYA